MRATPRITESDVLLFAAGAFSSILYFSLLWRPITGGGEPIAIAESIVRHGRFADPFSANGVTGPTAHLAPLLPLFLAAWYLSLGKVGAFGALACMTVIHGLHAALLPRFSQRFLARAEPGLTAAICGVALPIYFVEPLWENMYSAVGIVAFCLITPRLESAKDSVKCGTAAGVLILLNPSSVVIVACWLTYLFYVNWPGRNLLRIVTPGCLTCSLVLLPWEVRNYLELGGFTFIRDSLGLELYVANNDCASATLVENMANGCHHAMHPLFSKTELRDMQRLGELKYNADRQCRALTWIANHQARFWTLTRERCLRFWFPPGQPCTTLLTWLSIVGLSFAAWKHQKIALFAALALLLFPLPYYVVQMSDRFRYPIMWISLLFAGYALNLIWIRVSELRISYAASGMSSGTSSA